MSDGSARYFWDIHNTYVDQQAVVINQIPDCVITGADLLQRIDEIKGWLLSIAVGVKEETDSGHRRTKKLGCILVNNQLQDLIFYLAALQVNDAVMLLDGKMNPQLLRGIVEQYRPDWITGSCIIDGTAGVLKALSYEESRQDTLWFLKGSFGEEIKKVTKEIADSAINEQLAVLLSTSGTTGNPKMVRLSKQNLQANAQAIATYLNLHSQERAITSLPMSYSYGLSVINSHLLAGGTLLLTNESVMSKAFWQLFREGKATSLAGAPYMYQMLHRLRLSKMELPSLRTLTQAGGRLSEDLARYFGELAEERAWRFFVMYGQTEATARMSYLPPEMLLSKLNSIGIAIPGGKFEIDEQTEELIYYGANVMLGYAEDRSDLSKGDECQRRLATGDIAICDAEGYYYITGRLKRFIKLFGLRVNLDDLEQQIQREFHINIACTGNDEQMNVWLERKQEGQQKGDMLLQLIKQWIGQRYQLHHTAYTVKAIEKIPVTNNGKIDYIKLLDL